MANNEQEISIIDPNYIKDKDNFKSLIDFVICEKCKNILLNPKECSICNGIYCSTCIESNIAEPGVDILLKCPKSCVNSNFSTTKMTVKLLSKLEFVCLKGCDNILVYDNYLNHVNSCYGKMDKCPICESIVKKENISQQYFSFKKELIDLKIKDSSLTKKYNNSLELSESLSKQLEEILAEKDKSIKFIETLESKCEISSNQLSDYNLKLAEILEVNQRLNQTICIIQENLETSLKDNKKLIEENLELKNRVNYLNRNNFSEKEREQRKQKNYYTKEVDVVEVNLKSRLDISNNINEFSEAIKDSSIVKLITLASCGLGDKEIEVFSRALRDDKEIKMLNLSDNRLGDIAMNFIANCLLSNKNICQLTLNYNLVGDKGCEYLGYMIKETNSLLKLSLANNKIYDNGSDSICTGLKVNKSITYLDMSWNQITDKGAEQICAAIKSNNTLINWSLSNNKFGEKGVRIINEAITFNNRMTKIDLKWNNLNSLLDSIFN